MTFRPTLYELAHIRSDADTLLPINVTTYRPAYTRTSAGGSTMAYTLVDQGPGRLAAMGAEQELFAQKLGNSAGWMISLQVGRVVRVDDQLRITGGRIFEVIGTNYGTTDYWLQRVPCREITD